MQVIGENELSSGDEEIQTDIIESYDEEESKFDDENFQSVRDAFVDRIGSKNNSSLRMREDEGMFESCME